MTPQQALANLDAAARQLSADRETHKVLVISAQVLAAALSKTGGQPHTLDDDADADPQLAEDDYIDGDEDDEDYAEEEPTRRPDGLNVFRMPIGREVH